jgi:nitroreductase
VPNDLIAQAVSLAQLSPSACNRQPCKVYVAEDEILKNALLSHQNGNSGFGHLAPIIFVVTSNSNHFFGAIERNQPFIDGGLFSMSLLFALQTQGLVSCCLNWCVSPSTDSAVHTLLNIPKSERIIMYIAAGFPVINTTVPKSHRKEISNALVFK